MTGQPQNRDLEALEDATHLMRYATRSKLTLSAEIVRTVFEAGEASDNGKWSPEIAAKFWTAFSSLCTLIAPATVDSVYANMPTEARPRWYVWLFRARPLISVAERSAQRYVGIMLFLLLAVTGIAYAVETSRDGIQGIEKLLDSQKAVVETLQKGIAQNETALGDRAIDSKHVRSIPDAGLRAAVHGMQMNRLTLRAAGAQTWQEARTLPLFVFYPAVPIYTGLLTDEAGTVGDLEASVKDFTAASAYVASIKSSILGAADFVTKTLLPILLGMLGACAYVVRHISDQIRDTTYARTSPTQHLVRVGLGALAGIVIGFGGIVDQSANISAAAWAFAAGYAIEPVFAVIDSIAEKLRNLRSGDAGVPQPH